MKNQHGGARPGSGRPRGSANQKTREIADKAANEGETPLEFMLRLMRDPKEDMSRRADMAKSAAPYIHPRLSSIDAALTGDVGLKVEIVRFSDDPSPE